jgi:DNA-binding LacI/PurR family transcriptional regulator
MSKIDDVAKLAKVSKGTVSNVFSGKRPTSKEVKKRVLEAAKKLNYSPNHIARSLVTKQTMIIGLKMSYGKNLFLTSWHTHLISGVLKEAALRNYRVLIDTIPQKDLYRPYLSTDPMDGVIVLGPKKVDERIDYLKETGIPFVIIGTHRQEGIAYVDSNNEEMVFNVTRLLIKKGHQRILFLNAPEAKTVSYERERGFFRAFRENNLSVKETDNIYNEHPLEDPTLYGYKITKNLFEQAKEINYTAIIADTDQVALGVLKALKELDKNVPKDVSLVALSDDFVLSHEIDPPLTTVKLFPEKLGEEAVKLLIEKIEN